VYFVILKIEKLKKLQSDHQKGKRYMGNTIFMHRSPLSVGIHTNNVPNSIALVNDLKSIFNISIVYCWSDDIRRMERIAERNYWAEGQVKHFLGEIFNEQDQNTLKGLLSQYEELVGKGMFDAKLPTTSTKQATAQLLTMCDIGMKDLSNFDV